LLINHENSGQPGTRYLSGFSGSHSYLIITKQDQFIITDGRYFSQVKKEARDFELIKLSTEQPFEILKNLCEKLKVKKILIDSNHTFHSSTEKLKMHIENLNLVHLPGLLQEIRMVKEPGEIILLKRAAHIASKAFIKLLPLIKAGVGERFLADKLEFLIKEEGADRVAFDTIVVSGKNGALPHGKPTDKKIGKGELVTFDFGAYFEGYASDMTRTIAVGKASGKLKEIYEVVRRAQELGSKKARAGILGRELDKVCRDYIKAKGYGRYFLHGTGHGIGMEVHELPSVSFMNPNKLPLNSVITCEPGIYIEGLGGVRIEDMLVLRRGGSINLTDKIGKNLLII